MSPSDGTKKKLCRILVVDDDESLRAVVSQVLLGDGHDITTAASGEEALEIFRKSPYPLVFTDIVMGNMSGMELLHEIKKLRPETYVVVMSSNASPDTASIAIRAGAFDYLTKPFEDIELISNTASRAVEKIHLR